MPAPTPPPQGFNRLTHPDPATNRIIQDLYDKLSIIQSAITNLGKTTGTNPLVK